MVSRAALSCHQSLRRARVGMHAEYVFSPSATTIPLATALNYTRDYSRKSRWNEIKRGLTREAHYLCLNNDDTDYAQQRTHTPTPLRSKTA